MTPTRLMVGFIAGLHSVLIFSIGLIAIYDSSGAAEPFGRVLG